METIAPRSCGKLDEGQQSVVVIQEIWMYETENGVIVMYDLLEVEFRCTDKVIRRVVIFIQS